MLNAIWLGLIVLSVIFGVINNRIPQVVSAVTDAASLSITIAIGLVGIMVFWLGLMRVLEKAGLIAALARLIRPIMTFLFPEVPADHPAMGAMLMNMAANMLGLNNAATPFGLRAMEYLEKLNKHPGVASNAMCTFLTINTAGVQLIPTTAIAYLAAAGADNPASIVFTTLVATSCSTIAGVIAVKLLQRLPRFRLEDRA